MKQQKEKYAEFIDWFLEKESNGIRSERCYESFDNFNSELGKTANLLVWLEAAFNAGRETVMVDDPILYSEEYDAYYNAATNEWIEPRCDDRSCHYCINRPDKPML